MQANFLDDGRYAENYLRSHPSRGKIRIKFELLRKGIDAEILRSVLEGSTPQSQTEDALTMAKAWWQRKNQPGADHYKLKQQLMSKLSRQGFEYEVIRQVLEQLIK